MNGAHDMGGRMDYGPINPEKDEPVFHRRWEGRMLAIARALGPVATWNLDEDRSVCENRPPAEYLRLSYYEIWLAAMEKLLVDKGMATADEVRAGHALTPAPLSPLALRAAAVANVSRSVQGYSRPATARALFALGEVVRARNLHPAGHTRLPRYLRGRNGVIARVHGVFVFPDSNAAGRGEDPQWLYTVRFTAREVWGAENDDLIHAEMWEPYLEPA